MSEWRTLATLRIAGSGQASRVPRIPGGAVHDYQPNPDRPERCAVCDRSRDYTIRLDGPRVHPEERTVGA